MDLERFQRLSGLRALPIQGVLRGLLRPGLQGAAGRILGDPSDRRPRHLPQLGLPDPPPDLLRLARREGRVTNPLTPATLQVDVYLTAAERLEALRDDVRRGLTSTPKELPPKWFYDE